MHVIASIKAGGENAPARSTNAGDRSGRAVDADGHVQALNHHVKQTDEERRDQVARTRHGVAALDGVDGAFAHSRRCRPWRSSESPRARRRQGWGQRAGRGRRRVSLVRSKVRELLLMGRRDTESGSFYTRFIDRIRIRGSCHFFANKDGRCSSASDLRQRS